MRLPAWLVGFFEGRHPLVVCAFLAGLAAVAFLPVLKHDFIVYDDPDYVTSNLDVQPGLTWAGLRWAFANTDTANWHPLTWLSHMMDCKLYGLHPSGHHLTSLALHAANTSLLFLILLSMTGASGRSFLAALLFGLHPVHVESVAWVAERKDVLSTFFFLLSIRAYVRYVRRGEGLARTFHTHHRAGSAAPVAQASKPAVSPTSKSAELNSPRSVGGSGDLRSGRFFYAMALFFFAFGLMSKPMVVTLPFVLLLLDWWPLQRFRFSTPGPRRSATLGLLVEKTPFFALSAVSSALTVWTQQEAMNGLSLGYRLENALISYCRYLGKLVWPENLAVFYPLPERWPPDQVALAGLLLCGASILVLAFGRRCRYLPTGWFWFLGTLVPVIGLVQVGAQSMADRYAYIPSIGALVLVAWGAFALLGRIRYGSAAIATLALVASLFCFSTLRKQLSYWQNSEALFRHAIAVTGPSWTALTCLGGTLRIQERFEEAIPVYRQAIRQRPNGALGHSGLGAVLFAKGQFDTAVPELRSAVELKPRDPLARNDLGAALFELGRLDEAMEQYREALKIKPHFALTHYNLAAALRKQGHWEEAVAEYRQAIKLAPAYARPRIGLGNALLAKGLSDQAIAQYRQAIRLEPENTDAHNDLGKALEVKGQLAEAVGEYRQAIKAKPGYAEAHYNMGVALAEQEHWDEAIKEYGQALTLRPGHAAAHTGLGMALLRIGRLDDALGQCQQAVALEPANAQAHCTVGHLLLQKGRLDDAITEYREAIHLRPALAEPHYFLGGALAERGRPDEAIAQFKEALRIQPGYVDAENDLGMALDAKGQSEEAITHFQRVIKLKPDYPEGHNNLGVSLSKAGKLDDAISQFRETLRLKPDHSGARNNLAGALAAKTRDEKP
ncbi:MAG TPA: tetratricopeptide repeat protein [Candidatus Acidoferrum sp.]|jgi:tetratricopeptide (TPR) repeat protein|nr:tetratricopeptide repeat protein [Candidatus Acidoferrum sp.]